MKEDTENEIFISVATFWEIAIKVGLGKLEMSLTLPTIIQQTEESGFIILPIFSEHTVCVSSLPFHHRDPFDRILIAQAIVEELTLISKDPFLSEYQVNCIWDN